MAGQRTTIKLGGVEADVSLQNVAGTTSATRWETKTLGPDGQVIVEGTAEHVGAPLLLGQPPFETPVGTTGDDAPSLAPEGVTRDEAEQEAAAAAAPVVPETDLPEAVDPASLIPARAPGAAPIIPVNAAQALERDVRLGVETPIGRSARGVTREDGTFVDLTKQLAEIDREVKLEGMEISAAIPAAAVPRSRIIGAKYVVPQDPESQKVCALLYMALREESSALAVRWSKRTNQALGIIVASARHNALVLLEVEWAAAERPVPAAGKVTEIEFSEAERAAAIDYVRRNRQPASALNELEDDRARLHGELLEAARQDGAEHWVPIHSAQAQGGGDLAAAIAAGS